MFKPIVSHIAIFCLCFSQTFSSRAFAQNLPIRTDGATNTQVTQTASGIDQINIAAPNSSGLSHNTFTDYNVNQAGQVINNFSGQNAAEVAGGSGSNAVTATQIAGLVAANENLAASGSARIILNEVTSTNETYLNGYAEIAGTRAELIIANPNGISCSGCGFINTSKFSLIAGSSEFDQSGNLGFNIKEQKDLAIPLITISGLGLDAENISSANIIASSIKLLATIYGGENTDVNLKAGDGKYNYATGQLTNNNEQLTNSKTELFAIDASNLGAIQAGRIFITATRAGFGVNLGGDLIAAKEMDIDAAGNIFYHNISAGENANLTSNRNIIASDSTAKISAPNLNLQAAGEVRNSGNIVAYQLAISSEQLTNSGVIQALDLDILALQNLTNSSIIYGENSLKIAAENLTNLASGNIFSPQSYAINLAALLTNSGLIASDKQLTINSDQLTNSGEISAQNNLIISAATASNSGNLISAKTLTIQGQSLENRGQIQSADDLNINLTTLQNLENATIYSAKNLNLNLSNSLTNFGEISAQNNFAISGQAALSNSNKILAFGDLNIVARSLSNNQNAIISSLASSLILTLSQNLSNSGELSANQLTINSYQLTNSGSISSTTDLRLSTFDYFSNSGNLISSQKATINVAALTNQISGVISSGDDLEIKVTNSLSNLGEISTQKNLSLSSFDLENFGTIYAAQNFEIIAQNNLSNSGLLYSENDFALETKNFSNQLSGQIFSAENLGINIAKNFTNSGILQSAGTLNLSSTSALNSGEITAKQLTISNQETFENSGAILSQNNLTLSTNNFINSGDILSEKTLSLITQNLNNSGNLQTNSDLFLTSQSFDNSGSLISAQAMINVAALTNQISGVISAGDDLKINVTNSLSNFGEISTQKNLSLTSFDLENSGTIYAANNLEISTQNNFNNSGLLYSENDFALTTKNFTNQLSGQIFSAKNLNVNSSESLTNSGILQSDGTLNLSSSSTLNSGSISANQLTISNQETLENSGKIFSQTDLTLSTKNLTNSGIISSINHQLLVANSLLNSGELSSQKNLQISSINLTNSGNILSNEALSIITQNLSNSGNLQSNLDFNLTAQNFENSGNLISEQKATINVDGLTNQISGVIYAANNLEISAQNNLDNAGLFYSENNLTLSAKNFTNSGTASATNDHQLSITNSISNSGEISAQNNLVINAAAITNSANIFSSELLSITAASLENQSGATLASIKNSLNLNLSNHFTNRGQVFAGKNLSIFGSGNGGGNGGGNFTNSGSLSAQNNFTLSANIFDNSATISADELTLNLISFNNSGSINSLSNLTINATSSGTNSGEILSGKNLIITAIDLTNSNKIHSENSLLLTLRNLTNSQEITSVGSFTINASAAISNSKKLQSGSTFIINADSFVNSANALTLANGNLSITAKNISNQNTKPSNSIIATGLVSVSGNIILRTDNLNNNSGIIAAKSTTLTALNNSSVILTNTLGKFISTANINLNLGDADYAITGVLEASDIDITARNITNSGQVSATDFIKLTANGSAISGNGNITNSAANSSLSAGSYLTLIANRLITNYGIISAETDLTLTANSSAINNYGSITGGSGTTAINAAGSFNNALTTSKLTAANNLNFNIGDDLNNYGEISAANDITANVADSLSNNPTALIWSGRDSVFNVANSFINNQADIYSDRNLTIQKSTSTNDSLNKTTLLQNISGNIETYSGDIIIKAATLENKRAIDVVNKKPRYYTQSNWQNDWNLIEKWCFGDNCGNKVDDYFVTVTKNSNSFSGKINSGNNLTIESNNFNNLLSEISAAGNTAISANVFVNSQENNLVGNAVYRKNGGSYSLITPMYSRNSWDGVSFELYRPAGYTFSYVGTGRYHVLRHQVVENMPSYYFENFFSLIKSGGSVSITQNGVQKPSLINGTTIAQYTQPIAITEQNQSTTFNNIDSYALAETGVINVDLTKILSAINGSAQSASSKAQSSDAAADAKDNLSNNPSIGNVEIAIIPDAKNRLSNKNQLPNDLSPTEILDAKNNLKTQFETPSSQSTINSPNLTTTIPDTIFSGNFKINFNADPNVPLVEARSQFTDISKFYGSSYYFTQLGFNGDDFIQQLDQLTQNTVRIFGDAYVEERLIAERLHSLRKDAMFLSNNSTNQSQEIRDMINNSVAEISRLGLSATSVAANGLSSSQANLLTKDIITFEVQNVNGIMANGMMILVPKIYLSQASRTNLLGSGSSDLSNPSIASSATIFGKTSITINAPNASLTNSGSIISAGNITLNLASLTNKTNSNIKAEITAGIKSAAINTPKISPAISPITYTPANLSITTSGDIKNIGAKLFAANQLNLTSTSGSILNSSIITTNDKTLLDSNSDSYLENGLTLRTTNKNISSNLLHSASITAGEINISAANNFTNLAAALSAKKNNLSDSSTSSGDVNITAGNDIKISTLQLRNRSEESWGNKKKGGTSISDSTTNLQSELTSAGDFNLTTTGLGADSSGSSNINITGAKLTSAGGLSLAAHDEVNILAAQNTADSLSYGRTGKGKSYLNSSESITQIGSELTATNNGNILIASGIGNLDVVGSVGAKGSIAILASKLTTKDTDNDSSNNSGNGNITLVAKENLTISSALNSNYSESFSSKKGMTVKKSSTQIDSSATNVSSEINASGDIETTSGNDTKIIASNLTSAASGSIISGGETNILNGVDTKYYYLQTTKTKTGFDAKSAIEAAAMTALVVGSGGAALAAIAVTGGAAGVKKDTKTNTITTYDETIVKSNLSFNNSLSITSAKDLNVQSSDLKTTNGDMTLLAGNNLNITSAQETHSSSKEEGAKGLFGSRKLHTTKNDDTTTISSELTSANNLTLTSANDTTLQSAKLTSGVAGINNSQNLTINSGNDLLLLTSSDTHSTSYTNNKNDKFTFSNGTSGFMTAIAINNKIRSDGGSNLGTSGEITFNTENNILAQYKNTGSGTDTSTFASNPALAYLNNLDPSKAIYNPIDETHINWDQTTRGLTSTGSAVVAIAAVAVTVATLGAAAPVTTGIAAGGWAAAGATATVAVASTAAATASVSTTNSSMNADGNLLGSLDDVSKTTFKDSTSSNALRSYAIAGITAGAASGLSEYVGISEMSRVASTTNGTRTAAQVLQNAKVSLIESAISNTTSSVVQSAISGNNLSNSINSLAINIAVGAVANAAAKEIGNAAHPTDHYGNALPSQINKATQLTLHATLGCATGAAQGGNCGAGAAAGVIGEMVGEALKDSVINQSMSRQHAIQLAGLSGSVAALFASAATGQSDEQTAENIFVGQRIGGNAAANNALRVWVQPVRLGFYHTSTIHEVEPSDEKFFESDPRYQRNSETGKLYMTLGGGPNPSLAGLGNLTGEINRPLDILTSNKVYQSQNLVSPELDIQKASQLYWNNQSYKDALPYQFFPTQNSSGYNSNSYTAGLLGSVDIAPPTLPKYINYSTPWQDREYPEHSPSIYYPVPLITPGYSKPVPKEYFGVK